MHIDYTLLYHTYQLSLKFSYLLFSQICHLQKQNKKNLTHVPKSHGNAQNLPHPGIDRTEQNICTHHQTQLLNLKIYNMSKDFEIWGVQWSNLRSRRCTNTHLFPVSLLCNTFHQITAAKKQQQKTFTWMITNTSSEAYHILSAPFNLRLYWH